MMSADSVFGVGNQIIPPKKSTAAGKTVGPDYDPFNDPSLWGEERGGKNYDPFNDKDLWGTK
jgi:hypothetical protein